ncbi:hypothetical protein V2J09_013912 [Rumex salicifolius]
MMYKLLELHKGSNVKDGRRSGSPIGKGNGEKEPLLEQYVKVVSSWEFEGILSIGTLEVDPLIINLQHNNQCEVQVCSLYTHKIRDVETKCNQEIDGISEEIVQEEMIKMEKRVTLLDLLLAEKLEVKNVEEANPTNDHGNGENELPKAMKTKKNNKLKVGLVWKQGFSSKPNKLVPKDDGNDDKRPLKNQLQRFVTRMTKKKIHPDMDAGLQKKAQGKLNDDVPLGDYGLSTARTSNGRTSE